MIERKFILRRKQRITAIFMSTVMLLTSGAFDVNMAFATNESDVSTVSDNTISSSEPEIYEGKPDDTVSTNSTESTDIFTDEQEEITGDVILETYDDETDLSVSITGDAEVLFDASEIVIEPVDDVSSWQKAVDAIDDDSEREVVAVYDISLTDEDGNVVEPDDSVLVSLAGGAVTDAIYDDRQVEIYHMPENTNDIDNVYARTHASDTVVFDTDGFSEYAVVLRDDGNTQIETDLHEGNEWFELDKYLTVDAESGYVNGQPKATITIEQVYHTDGRVKLEKLPARSDIILEIGASSSMSGSAQYQNEYILNFLYRVMLINQEREQKAKNNEYSDLVYTGDDEQFEKDMENHWIYIDGCLKYNNAVYIENEDRLLIRSWADVCSLIQNECGYNNGNSVGCGHVHYYFDWSDKVNPIYSNTPNAADWLTPVTGGEDWNLHYEYTRPAYECAWSGKLACQNTWNPIANGSALTAMSRTDLASKQAKDWVMELYDEYDEKGIDGDVSVILLTDSAPYGYGASGTFRYNEERDVFGSNANDALSYAKTMKERGATIYVGYTCIENKSKLIDKLQLMDDSEFRLATGDLRHSKTFDEEWNNGDNDDGQGDMSYREIYDDMSDVMFMSAYSSDYIHSGTFILENESSSGYGDGQPVGIAINTINNDVKLNINKTGVFSISGSSLSSFADVDGSGNFIYPYTVKNSSGKVEGYNTFGTYMFSTSTINKAEDNINEIASICTKINKQAVMDTNDGNTGYAGVQSYIYDEITDPFSVTNIHDIKVYAVPRIPKDIDENTGIPKSFDASLDCSNKTENMQTLSDSDFRWGEKLIKGKFSGNENDPSSVVATDDTTEWIDITNRVNIDSAAFKKGIIKISGIDYEHAYSVRDYDIDYVKTQGTTNSTEKPGGGEEPGTTEPGTGENPESTESSTEEEPESTETESIESSTEEESESTETETIKSSTEEEPESTETESIESSTEEESESTETETIKSSTEEESESTETETTKPSTEEESESTETDTEPETGDEPSTDDNNDPEIIVNSDGLKYKTGDYGYKIVVEIPIVSNTSFGGNNIKTNNTETSGFYPSVPSDGKDPWADNAYVALYPECKMNLACNYNVVTDNAIIYAPETKKLRDLLTDSTGYLWYTDEHYFNNLSALNQANNMLDSLMAQRAGTEQEYSGYADPNSAEALKCVELIHTFDKQIGEWSAKVEKLKEEFATYKTYVPDGINNAFVDITYTATLPSGATFATMVIPHGKSFWFDKDGNPSINWTIEGGDNALVTESGTYKISATITPVATTKSPSWHVSTEADGGSDYSSLEYSSTGSDDVDAAPNITYNDIGPQQATVITGEATAYIYVLEITTNDGQKEPGSRIDVNFGTKSADGTLKGFAIKSGTSTPRRNDNGVYDCTGNGMTYIQSFRWICTDGKTPSAKENEPTWPGHDTGTDVNVKTTIPDEVIGTDKVVKEVNGMHSINTYDDIDGEWVPIRTTITRDYKSINKGDDENAWCGAVDMSDTDNRYGSNSSIRWIHKCESGGLPISDTCEYDDGEFNTAIAKYGADVHYLIHVVINVPPELTKEVTESSVISTSDTFKWTITTSNNNAEVNKHHRNSSYTLVDILPHANDGRGASTQYGWLLDNKELGSNGSYINGVLRYKSIKIDFSNAPSAKAYFLANNKMSFTSSSNVYNNLNPDDVTRGNGVTWSAANNYTFDGNILSFSGFDSSTIYAFRLESVLAFGETLSVYIEADTAKSSDKKENNIVINEAFISTGKGFVFSTEVPIEVVGMSISGQVWIDTDGSNTMTVGESRVGGVTIGIYRKKEAGDKQAAETAKSYKLPNGSILQLAKAFNIENNAISNTLTADDGSFVFTNLNAGTYYIIADTLPQGYNLVTKQAAGSRNASIFDSEAEEYFLDNGDDKYLNNTAIIKEVQVGLASDGSDTLVKGINIGLTEARGAIYVGKTAEQIKIPSTFTDEQRKDFKTPVIFYLKNTDTGVIYAQTVLLTEDNYKSYAGQPQVFAAFENIPLGHYEVWESDLTKNEIVKVETEDANVTTSADRATVTLDYDNTTARLWFANKLLDHDTFSYNAVAMHVPVKLELKYTGPDPVGMKNNDLYYRFKDEDFEDYIVTYDDGTTISKKAGTLKFSDLVLTPGSADDPITRFMNTTGNEKIVVTGFYVERGIVVTDSFRVGVTLKPLYKFTVRFKNNYDAGEGGNGFTNVGFQENIVTYLYDEASKKVEVTSGLYMDQANGGLSKPWFYYDHSKYFRQYGWNTEYDGSGSVMPIDLNKTNIENVLVSIGEYMRGNNPTHTVYSDMTWWAEWRGEASFVAGYNNNDGHIDTSSGCQTSTSQVTVTYSKNGRIWYNDKGHIDNAAQISYFDHWNRASSSSNPTENAAGNDLELGVTRFRGGEVFYAIYYIADFKYTGQYAVFTAPTDGSYTFQLWGSPGGNRYSNNASDGTGIGGNGGYTEVTMNLSRNQSIYTFVGSAGAASRGDACAGGFNGGGPSLVCMAGPHSASGGGATHISNVNNPIISDLFVKLIGTPDPNEEDDSEDDGSNDEGEGDGSTDPTTDTYSYETVTLYYGKSLKGATQAELIAFVRNKLMTNDNWYKSYINNSTNITEVGLYRSYSNGKRKGGTNNAKTAWFLIECHTWNSINETIAIAGGGSGGSSIKNLNGMVYGWGGGDTADRGYGGNNANNKRATFNSNMKMADNSAGIGYAQGTGMYNSNSSGGGGGWWSGYSSSCYGQIKYQKKGGRCGDICGGGTSYVNTDNNKVTITDSFTIAGNDSRLSPGGSYEKPRMYDIGINGYVKVTKNSGW